MPSNTQYSKREARKFTPSSLARENRQFRNSGCPYVDGNILAPEKSTPETLGPSSPCIPQILPSRFASTNETSSIIPEEKSALWRTAFVNRTLRSWPSSHRL